MAVVPTKLKLRSVCWSWKMNLNGGQRIDNELYEAASSDLVSRDPNPTVLSTEIRTKLQEKCCVIIENDDTDDFSTAEK